MLIEEFDFKDKLIQIKDNSVDFIDIGQVFEIILGLNVLENINEIFIELNIGIADQKELINKLSRCGLSSISALEKIEKSTTNNQVKEKCDETIDFILKNRSLSIKDEIKVPKEKTLNDIITLINNKEEFKFLENRFSDLDKITKEKRDLENKIDVIKKDIIKLEVIEKNEYLTSENLTNLKNQALNKKDSLDKIRTKIQNTENSISNMDKEIKISEKELENKSILFKNQNQIKMDLKKKISNFEDEIDIIIESNSKNQKISSFYEKRREYLKERAKVFFEGN